jgi:catalase
MAEKPTTAAGNAKFIALQPHTVSDADAAQTTNNGTLIADDVNSLKAGGARGPSLLEDFLLREKITHFDHERIPERVVHARGAGAHGVFHVYDDSLKRYTRAAFLTDPALRTPVFVRFSTVAGSRGSTDLARDVRGFATKFYTQEGIFDLVGNNIPVFFIQDAMKFPDLIHAAKPEPHHEIPQAQTAHDTFWDFISLSPESAHMIMWAMSDRAIPRSFRMMEGFGVHTFRLVNSKNESVFVKFHWKPLLGLHAVTWEEALTISGKDPDFHRRDLWEAIASGNFPEWELGLQIVEEKDEHSFDFDLLDPTKIIPEELVPVKRVGRLTLNRNPANFFAETEQIAFHPGHVVPGIDFTNDPLLQGRLFSYLDTQLTRLGGPNFMEIPINRPLHPPHNNQRDGFMRQQINPGRAPYHPNSLGGGCPFQSPQGFISFAEKLNGPKARDRSKKFFDHFTQAALFYRSQSPAEQLHIAKALQFELSKVETEEVRVRMIGILSMIDQPLAQRVATALGATVPDVSKQQLNFVVPSTAPAGSYEPLPRAANVGTSPALSMLSTPSSAATRKVALIVNDGFDGAVVQSLRAALKAKGAIPIVVGAHLGAVKSAGGEPIKPEMALFSCDSVLFDAVCVMSTVDAASMPLLMRFMEDTFRHCKPLAMEKSVVSVAATAPPPFGAAAKSAASGDPPKGVAVMNAGAVEAFVHMVGERRLWERELALA